MPERWYVGSRPVWTSIIESGYTDVEQSVDRRARAPVAVDPVGESGFKAEIHLGTLSTFTTEEFQNSTGEKHVLEAVTVGLSGFLRCRPAPAGE
jgi:hypothetical protein